MPSFTFTTFTAPAGFDHLNCFGINDSGEVVGSYSKNDLPHSVAHGFAYHNGVLTTLDDLYATKGTVATGVNAAGVVIGNYQTDSATYAFIDRDGHFTTIQDPHATTSTKVTAINRWGTVVGTYRDASGTHGFRYRHGVYTTIDDPHGVIFGALSINDAGEIAGTFNNGGGTKGFVYSAGNYTTIADPLGGQTNYVGSVNGSHVEGIDAAGDVVGTYYNGGGIHGFIESQGSYKTLNGPYSDPNSSPEMLGGTEVDGVDAAGAVLGDYIDYKGRYHTFLYSDGAFTLLTEPSATAYGTVATAVSAAGLVVGTYSDTANNNIETGFIATPVTAAAADLTDTSRTFVFKPHFGEATIADFMATGSHHDILDLSATGLSSLAEILRQTRMAGGNAVIHLTPTDTITLANVTKAELASHPGDFRLPG